MTGSQPAVSAGIQPNFDSPQHELKGVVSVECLLDHYDALCVPHFQRGLVWDANADALLLESLYLGTPCGSIILWEHESASGQGVPLGSKPRYLIVDGQQRIRSLWGIFKKDGDESLPSSVVVSDSGVEGAVADSDEDEGDGIWCLNLGRVRELEAQFAGGRRFRLFRKAKDPRLKREDDLKGALRNDRDALLPLRWFLKSVATNGDSSLADILREEPAWIKRAARAVLDSRPVLSRLQTMQTTALFHVFYLEPSRSLADVVGHYNRINSAGKRVEAEERAFASLVANHSNVNNALREFFSEAEGGKSAPAARHRPALSAVEERDEFLHREKEHHFGFKLFMRTFVQVWAYHSDRGVGSSAFSFDSLNPEVLANLKQEQFEKLENLLGLTRTLLAYVRGILRDPLFCDDLRMLPETSSLWPVFQLLICFPELMPVGKDAVASLTLRLLLARKRKDALLAIVDRISNCENLAAAWAVCDRDPDLLPTSLNIGISRHIEKARSPLNRYVLMLYWLLRSKGARDFSYKINIPEKIEKYPQHFGDGEVLLSEDASADKQHIVPYARLKKIYGLEGKARPSQHVVNDIGNLTYISHAFNDYKTGIGSKAVDLRHEPHENLGHHLLLDERSELFEHYEAASGHGKADRSAAKRHYEDFCRVRKGLIKSAFLAWVDSVCGSSHLPSAAAQVLPAERLISPSDDDRIRGLDCPLQIKADLVLLRKIKGMQLRSAKNSSVVLVFRPKTAGRKQVISFATSGNGEPILIHLRDHKLRDWLGRLTDGPTQDTHGRCALPRDAGAAHVLLEQIGERLKGLA